MKKRKVNYDNGKKLLKWRCCRKEAEKIFSLDSSMQKMLRLWVKRKLWIKETSAVVWKRKATTKVLSSTLLISKSLVCVCMHVSKYCCYRNIDPKNKNKKISDFLIFKPFSSRLSSSLSFPMMMSLHAYPNVKSKQNLQTENEKNSFTFSFITYRSWVKEIVAKNRARRVGGGGVRENFIES